MPAVAATEANVTGAPARSSSRSAWIARARVSSCRRAAARASGVGGSGCIGGCLLLVAVCFECGDDFVQVAGDLLWSQPFKTSNTVVNQLIKGWTVGMKMYIYSGAPFSVTDSKIATSVNSTGVLTPLADLVVGSAFNTSCNKSNAIGQSCLAKADFATYPGSGVSAPLQTDWGNIAPNSFRGPGYFDMDASLQRAFAIREKVKFTLGMQAYNVLNHANFPNPSGSLTSGAFGTITSTLGPPTSIYGTGQGASVSGRLAVLTATFTF